MTRGHPRDDEITSDDEFEATLAEAVETAIEAIVDVRGAWEFQTNGSAHMGDIVIAKVVKAPDNEDD